MYFEDNEFSRRIIVFFCHEDTKTRINKKKEKMSGSWLYYTLRLRNFEANKLQIPVDYCRIIFYILKILSHKKFSHFEFKMFFIDT